MNAKIMQVLATGAAQAMAGALLSMRAKNNFKAGNEMLTALLKKTKEVK